MENTKKINYFFRLLLIYYFLEIRDTFTEQLTPHEIDTGHLSENPAGWEERYERKNLKSQRFQGKVYSFMNFIV